MKGLLSIFSGIFKLFLLLLRLVFKPFGYILYPLFLFFTPFERMVAKRYLRSKKSEGFVSVIAGFAFTGIMLGVATLIIVMSVMNGFRQDLFDRILGLNGHMNVYGIDAPLSNYDYVKSLVIPVAGVVQASPIIQGQALASANGVSAGTIIRGIAWADFFNRPILRQSIVEGDLEDFENHNIAIGSVLAKKMGLRPGDKLTLTSPQVKSSPFGSLPRQRSYSVAVVFNVDMSEYDANFIFMPLEAAQVFFKKQGAVDSIEVIIKDPDRLDHVRNAVSLAVKGQAGVYDWRDTNKSFYDTLIIERNVMFLILTLIILIAAFNIISSMIMLVKDKTHDIAIMRTMGATRANMMRIFVLTGFSIGFMGTFVGSVLGISFALNIDAVRRFLEGLTGMTLWDAEVRWLSQIPAEIDGAEVVAVIFISLLLTIVFTLFPAWRAARLDPVEALRYE